MVTALAEATISRSGCRAVTARCAPALMLAVALSACAPAPVVERPAPASKPDVATDTARELEQRARLGGGRRAAIYLLRAAEIHRVNEAKQEAARVAAMIDEALLDTDQWLRLVLLRADLALLGGEPRAAYIELSRRRLLMALSDADDAVRLRAGLLRAQSLEGIGSYLAAAQERILLQPLLTQTDAIESNANAIWTALLQVPNPTLAQYLDGAISPSYRGWLELALVAKSAQLSLIEQNRNLQLWLEKWPAHTASRFLPAELASIEEMQIESPDSVALLLPLSGALGSSGRAIREGFLAAYYQSLDKGETVPSLQIIDSISASSFLPRYHSLAERGVNLVIGPLEKSKLEALVTLPELPVPTLALNYLDDHRSMASDLFQFGLSALDEAQQLVTRARFEGMDNALILAPNSTWGQDVATALNDQWLDAGGTVLDIMLFSKPDNFSQQLADSLLVGASQRRAADLRRQIGKHIEFEPRRRQDLDVVFLVAAPGAARALKPLLAFHYASDIPVYATSHIYSGAPDAERDGDLNGTHFIDMPWIAAPQGQLRTELARHPEFRDGRYQRLYALGVDAFRLAPRLGQWQQNRDGRVFGETGSLHLNQANQIVREGEWLRFEAGLPVADPIHPTFPYPELTLEGQIGQGGPTWQDIPGQPPLKSER